MVKTDDDRLLDNDAKIVFYFLNFMLIISRFVYQKINLVKFIKALFVNQINLLTFALLF